LLCGLREQAADKGAAALQHGEENTVVKIQARLGQAAWASTRCSATVMRRQRLLAPSSSDPINR